MITPNPGMDSAYDNAMSDYNNTIQELQDYLIEERKKHGSKVFNKKYDAKLKLKIFVSFSHICFCRTLITLVKLRTVISWKFRMSLQRR